MLNPEKNLVIMQGLPGSGKSWHAMNLARYCGYQLIQPDCIRYGLGIKHNGEGWTEAKEDIVRETVRHQRAGIMELGLPLVIDETHTKEGKVLFQLRMAQLYGYRVTIHRVVCPIEICKQRRAKDGFPLDVIDRMAENLERFDEALPVIRQQYPKMHFRITSNLNPQETLFDVQEERAEATRES